VSGNIPLGSSAGPVASAVGEQLSLVVIPKVSGTLGYIRASGDPEAVLLSVMAGAVPLVLDPMPCTLLKFSTYHIPRFDPAPIRAGVPIEVRYTAGTVGERLVLTFTSAETDD